MQRFWSQYNFASNKQKDSCQLSIYSKLDIKFSIPIPSLVQSEMTDLLCRVNMEMKASNNGPELPAMSLV